MEKRRLELRLANERRSRRLQIAGNIFNVIGIIVILWVVVSTIEVWYHNDLWFSRGIDTSYCPLNFWEICIKLGDSYLFKKIRGEV